MRPKSKTVTPAVFVTALLFFLLCLAFVPTVGIQNDEALFGTAQYGPIAKEFRLRAFKHDVPLMLMTYLGALKTWVFAAIFAFWKPSLWSMRVPPALIGSATIVLFAALLNRASNLRKASLFGAILLASDPSYLLTTVFDWGPVAFQHLFLVSGLLLLLQYIHTRGEKYLVLGFLCLGLGLWDKALLSWSLLALGLATLLVFPKELFRALTPRSVGLAVCSFLVGAAPLVLYNARNKFATFRGNTKIDFSEVLPKWPVAEATLDGSALFGYLVREEWETISVKPEPGTLAARSFALREAVGERRKGWGCRALVYAFVLGLPLWWARQRRAMLFGAIYLAAGWVLMAATHDAGGSAHHVVLLWPFPQFLVAIVLASLAERFGRLGLVVASLAGTLLVAQNLGVLNQYYTQATRFCGSSTWTDAILPLRDALVKRHPAAVNVMGWGMEFTLVTLEKGTLPLRDPSGLAANDNPSQDDRNTLQAILTESGGLFAGYTPDTEIQQGVAKRFEAAANREGFVREVLETIPDRCGRPTFEIYRYNKAVIVPLKTKQQERVLVGR